MGKQAKEKKSGSRAVSDGLDPIDPSIVFYTHSKIRPVFSGCGKSIQDTIDEITSGAIAPSELPFITVLTSGDGNFYSLNNRRLYVLKYLRSNGYLEPSNTIRVRLKTPLPREMKKYSPENCSLSASIMKERPVRATTAEPATRDAEKSGAEDGKECGDLVDKLAEASLSGGAEREDTTTGPVKMQDPTAENESNINTASLHNRKVS